MTSFQANLLAHVSASPGIPDRGICIGIYGDHGDKSKHNSETSRVNSEAHLLESRGLLTRQRREDGLVGNYPVTQSEKYFCLRCGEWVQKVCSGVGVS